MPRPNTGPKLALYGPDNRYGAKKRAGFKRYVWYVVWSDRGIKRERRASEGDRTAALEVLRAVTEELTEAARAQLPERRRAPGEVPIGDVLAAYGDARGPDVEDPVRMGVAMLRLSGFWGGRTVAEITKANVDAYVATRRVEFAKSERDRVARAKAARKSCQPPRTLSLSTARRELVVLRAAVMAAHATGVLTEVPSIPLPPEGKPRDRFLTRQQVARLVRAARTLPRARYLALFILIAFYTGARMRAILQLRWDEHREGGGWVDLERGSIDFLGHDEQSNKRRARIPIPDRLLTLLHFARKRTRQHVIEYEGQPIDDVKRAMGKAADIAKIGRVNTHMLKHSAISYLLGQGVSIWAVSRWTATSVATIEKVYGHLAQERTGEVQRALR